MRILRMLDAPSPGRWDAAAWERIARGAPELYMAAAGQTLRYATPGGEVPNPFSRRYTGQEVAVVVCGQWRPR